MEGTGVDRDRCDFLAGDTGRFAFASSGMERNPADDAELAGVAGTCAAAVYFWYRRQGHVIPIREIVSCSVASVTESPYASGSARNSMLILGLKDRNLGVNVSDRKNAIQAAQFLKTKNPRLTLMDIEEKKVSLTEIHTE